MSRQDLKFVIDTLADNQAEFVPRGKVRIACVAAIIRWKPYIMDNIDTSQPLAASALDFLNQPWVNDCHGEAEVLFIRRAKRPGDFWSGHVAFPGGKNEEADRNNLDTVVRECKEEIGLALDTPEYIPLGTLKPRHITRADSNKIMMSLVPHVFLQVSPITPKFTIQPKEVADTYWVPVRYLLETSTAPYDPMVNTMVGPGEKLPWPTSVRVPAIPLPTGSENPPQLWGMTLRMSQEILGMELSPHTVMSEEELQKFEKEEEKRKRNNSKL